MTSPVGEEMDTKTTERQNGKTILHSTPESLMHA